LQGINIEFIPETVIEIRELIQYNATVEEFFGDFLCVINAVAAKLIPTGRWKKRSKT
jgi:hypothetical protein